MSETLIELLQADASALDIKITAQEIAAKYDLPQRRVKYRLSCLRKDLRKHLNKEGVAV